MIVICGLGGDVVMFLKIEYSQLKDYLKNLVLMKRGKKKKRSGVVRYNVNHLGMEEGSWKVKRPWNEPGSQTRS